MNVVSLSVKLPGPTSSNAAQALDPAADAAVGDASTPLSSLFAALLSQQIGMEPSAKPVPAETASVREATATEPARDALLASLQQSAPIDPSIQIQQAAVAVQVPMQSAAPVDEEVQDVVSGVQAQPGVRHAYGRMDRVDGDSHGEARRQQVAANAAAFAGPERTLPDQANGVAPNGEGALRSPLQKPEAVKSEGAVDRVLAPKLQAAVPEAAPQNAASAQQSTPVPALVSAQTNPVQNPPATQTTQISPTLGHSAWGEAFGDRVVWMVSQQHQGVEMHLNPPSLGPLEVRLTMSDGQASLSFNTQHLPVKEAIESATPRLREMLGDSGISLGNVSVNVGSFSQPQQQAGQQQTPSRNSSGAWSDFMPTADFSSAPPSQVTRVRGDGMVDLFA